MGARLTWTDVLLKPELYFVIPGDLQTLTGGYAYDRALIDALKSSGVPVHHISLSGQFPRPDKLALTDAAAQLAGIPDQSLVLIDGLAYGVMDSIAAREHQRLNIIALCHHPLALESGLDATSTEQLFASEQQALQLACAVVVTSAATATLLTSRFGIGAERITVALPGTDRQAFAPCQGHPPCLLTVATLTRRKAHDVLITALARIRHLPWNARFVGGEQFDPAWSAALRAQVRQLQLEDRVLFAGSIDDLGSEYTNADVFVLPSRFEGYGMVFAEALSFGVPVVAARAGAVPDVVPETAGILVPADNAEALADALQHLLTSPADYQALRRGAQAAAAALPAWQDTATRILQVMNAVSARS